MGTQAAETWKRCRDPRLILDGPSQDPGAPLNRIENRTLQHSVGFKLSPSLPVQGVDPGIGVIQS
jgi:hypothetical protein